MGMMRDKIAELAIKEARWGMDGLTTPDPVEIGEAIADEIMGLLRQGPRIGWCPRGSGHYDGPDGEDYGACGSKWVKTYALVELPEEDGWTTTN